MDRQTAYDTLEYYNTGCDTLNMQNISMTSPNFVVDSLLGDILPGETGFIIVAFTPDSVGSFAGDMIISTNVEDTSICLTGMGILPPVIIDPSPDTLFVTLACGRQCFGTSYYLQPWS